MPDARITDILLEVDDATRFTEAFTHLRTGSPCRDRIGLLNVLLAEGIKVLGHGADGLEAREEYEPTTSRVSPHLCPRNRLRYTSRWSTIDGQLGLSPK